MKVMTRFCIRSLDGDPDAETLFVGTIPCEERWEPLTEDDPTQPGWYWMLLKSEVVSPIESVGPFDSETEAINNARLYAQEINFK